MEMEIETSKEMTRKEKKENWFAFLSDDIFLQILKKLPEAFLRYKAKHVCKRWFNIVTNRILLDHASFILQTSYDSTVRHVDITEEQQGLQVKVQNLEIPIGGHIITWCNEYLLVTDLEKHEYVFNVITNEGSFLPHCTSCGEGDDTNCGMALSFDGFKGVYKVLHVFMGPPLQCHILVLRRNILSRISSNWKKIEVPSYMDEWIPTYMYQRRPYWGDPVSVQARYFHWRIWDFHGERWYLVSMDMVKEKMVRMSLPIPESSNVNYTVFEMGGFLTLIHQLSSKKSDKWMFNDFQTDMWILKDFEMMKWEKLRISIPNYWYFGEYFKYFPDSVSGMMSMRYLTCIRLSNWDGAVCSYDLKDFHVKELDIQIGSNDRRVPHSSSPSFI
ncbi:uncharacterized protein LOC111905353 [Lactuca sativa]|uniref:uncharacterized protein LOC111905353 n=1 Tax=Lactuca sativa TaxID=4236 RepID=UPI000CBD7F96|nr:uncharacterized protein LOC111905353 [Lactuca sativa]